MIAEFWQDDAAYFQWLKQNPRGYVLNYDGLDGTRLHHVAGCSTIEDSNTTSFRKICSESKTELDVWFKQQTGKGLAMRRCTHCAVSSANLT